MAIISKKLKWVILVLFGSAVVLLVISLYSLLAQDLGKLEQHLNGLGPSGYWLFIAVVMLGTVIFLPISLFGVVGGAVFGTLWGTVLTLLGVQVASTIIYFLSRRLGFRLEGFLGPDRWDKLVTYQELMHGKGGVEVFVMRILHIFPHNMLNIAFGLSRTKFSTFFWGSLLASLPWVFAYAYFGRALITPKATNLSVALAIFAVLGWVGWQYRKRRQNVVSQVKYKWKLWRKIVGAVLIAVLLVLAFDGAYLLGLPTEHLPETKADVIVVLGSAPLSPAMFKRTIQGLRLYESGNGEVLVLSGGKTANRDISEAQYMARIVMTNSVLPPKFVLEDESKNTYENLANTRNLFPNAKSVLVVSDAFHEPRAVLVARAVGFSEVYWSAISDDYYRPAELRGYYLREFVAILAYLPKLIF